ncbi:TonB-dependent receptor domain-containing protein [Chondromyces apiculatus]|nr:TonB-dependent receptor [Chondromyces apiculatus]
MRWPGARALIVAAALSGAALAPGVARGDGLADEAEIHFDLGREAFKRRDYLAALDHFLHSNRLVPNRNVTFNIALAYEELGRFADAHRYYVDVRAAEDDPVVVAEIDEAIGRIAPEVAVLRVETSPPGATLYLDRRDLGSRGQSPRPLGLPEGRYRVIAELPGYEPAEIEGVEARRGQVVPVVLELRPIVGTLEIAVRGAPSAAVRVDDEEATPACTAPCALKLSPGRHLLHVSREGFQPVTREVSLAAHATATLAVRLEALSGSLLVRTDERDALVEVDGRPAGFTPTVIQGVLVGKRRVRVSLRGYAPVEREVEVRAGQQSRLLDIQLDPQPEVTTASRYAQSLDDAPASISVVDGREIRAFGYPTVAEALRGVRGVYLSNDHDVVYVGVRGIGEPIDYNTRVLLLSDRHPLNDNVMNSAFLGSEGRTNLHDVERIEVIRGPASVIYGTGAFAGVVNLVPRGRDEPSHVEASIGAYDDHTAQARAAVYYRRSARSGAWLSVAGARSDGIDQPVELREPGSGPRVRIAHGVDAFRSGTLAGRAWDGALTAQWLLTTRTKQVPAGLAHTVFDDPRTVYEDVRMTTELRFEPKIGDTLQIMARAHATGMTFQGDFAHDPMLLEDYRGTRFGLELRAAWLPHPRLRLTVGAEGQANTQASLRGLHEGTTLGEEAYLNVNQPYTFGAGYALAEGSLTRWLSASGGARVDLYDAVGPVPTFRGALIARPARQSTVKLMGGTGFRAPSIYEQFYDDGAQQRPAVDPARGLSLSAESVTSGEVEVTQRFLEIWALTAAVHGSHVSDLIRAVTDAAGTVRYVNSGSAVLAAGAEVELRREWRQGLLVGATYGYQLARYLGLDEASARLVNVPAHLASCRAVVPVFGDLAAAGVRVTVEAPRRIAAESEESTRAALLADLTLSGTIRTLHARYVLGIYNLLDAKHDTPASETFFSLTSRQNRRTLLVDLLVSLP